VGMIEAGKTTSRCIVSYKGFPELNSLASSVSPFGVFVILLLETQCVESMREV
jgi:hypothetical protein